MSDGEVRTPPRKLVDLNPKWCGVHGSDRRGVSLMFDCPCLDPNCQWGGKIVVDLANPLDGGEPMRWTGQPAKTYWVRTGDDFASLTLSPSVWCTGHWHGWIRNGEVISV